MKHYLLALTAAFCLSAGGQEVCHPPLVSFDVHRLQLEDGWLHTTGGMANGTRVTEVDYLDNRRIDQWEFISYGSVTLTNTHAEDRRKIKYRQSVDIRRGPDYTVTQDTPDVDICVEDDGETAKAVMYVDKILDPGESHIQEWYYSVEIAKFGDLNNDGCINGYDLGLLFSEWGGPGVADFNLDGTVNAYDMGIVLANWYEHGDCYEEPEEELYNPMWESADDIVAFTIDSFADGVILTENVTFENLKGGMVGIADDTGNSGTKFLHLFGGAWQVLGVSGWSPLDTWVVEIYDDAILVGRTSSDSEGPVYNPDGSSNYGNSIYWKPQIEPFKLGDRWVLYRWIDDPDTPDYPPSRVN